MNKYLSQKIISTLDNIQFTISQEFDWIEKMRKEKEDTLSYGYIRKQRMCSLPEWHFFLSILQRSREPQVRSIISRINSLAYCRWKRLTLCRPERGRRCSVASFVYLLSLVPESVSERYELGVTTTPLDRFGGCWAWVVPTFAWQDTMTNSFFCFRRALSFLLGKHVQRMTNNDTVR